MTWRIAAARMSVPLQGHTRNRGRPKAPSSEPTSTLDRPAARILEGRTACFVLFDAKADKIVERYGGERCAERNPPCSTFKVPLALMGFDSGVLEGATTTFKWDGKPKYMKSWERDVDVRTWIKESVVWYSQEVARRLGREKMAKYLHDLDYGNADISGNLDTAWLSPEPSPDSKVRSSIAISADEQVRFLVRLWRRDLPVAERAMGLTKEITFVETSPKGYALHGKTGTGYAGKGTKRRLGWFVGHLAKGNEEYVGVVSFTDSADPASGAKYAGPESRDLFKAIVAEMGYW